MTEKTTQIREITRDQLSGEHNALLHALCEQEAIHKAGEQVNRPPEEDIRQRVAESAESASTSRKRSFGIFVDEETLPRYVVYTYLDNPKPNEHGVVEPADYPHNMHDILMADNNEVSNPSVAACYTISRIASDAHDKEVKLRGGDLLSGMKEILQQDGIETVVTLSPMKEFEPWLAEIAADENAKASDYLSPKAQHWLAELSEDLLTNEADKATPLKQLSALFKDEHYGRMNQAQLDQFNDILIKVGRVYLKESSKPHPKKDEMTLMDVTQFFHQGNGAVIAKLSPQRMREDQQIIATGPNGESWNKLNVSYDYSGREAARNAQERPGNQVIEATYEGYKTKLAGAGRE